MGFVSIIFSNQTSYDLSLAQSLVYPDGWIDPPPDGIAAGKSAMVSSQQPNTSFTVVAGYTVDNGYSQNLAWAMTTYTQPPQAVTTDTAYDVKVAVDIQGNSEDGYQVTFTYS